MSNISNLTYETIDIPYDANMERSDTSVIDESIDYSIEQTDSDSTDTTSESSTSSESSSPTITSGGSLTDIWLETWIKSRNYQPGVQGLMIDGRTGNFYGANIFLTGGTIAYGKSSFTDSTNAGYIISNEGIYMGSASDASYIKYDIDATTLTINAIIEGGTIGGTTINATTIYGGIIQTSETVGVGDNGVIMDSAGLRGYDSVLGNTFNIPTNGDAPTFSSGIINSTIFEINTNAILRTSETVGDGSASSAGILINNTGLYGCEASQTLAGANLKALINGTISVKGSITITGGSGIASLTDAGDLVTMNEAEIDQTALLNSADAGADVTQTTIDGGLITTGYITLGTAGNIKSGQTAYETGTGFWLGNDGGTPKFSIGNTTNYMKWSGTALNILGGVITGGSIAIGSSNNIFKADSNGIYLGNATFASAPFSVSMAGALKASSATITGALTTGAGSSLDAQYISNSTIINTLTMGSAGSTGYIQSYGWNGTVSGFQLKGGTSPALTLIGGTITGSTIQTNSTTYPYVKINTFGIQIAGQSVLNFITSAGLSCGYIGAESGQQLSIYCQYNNVLIGSNTGDVVSSSNFRPSTDGSKYLGNSDYGWERLYLGASSRYLYDNSGTLYFNGSAVGGSGTVTSIATSGAISGGTITTTGTITHSTAAGYKHIPTSGASQQFLKYSASGTAVWSYLGATANATTIVPGSGTTNLGSSTYYWNTIYGGKLNLKALTSNPSTYGDIVHYVSGGVYAFRGITGSSGGSYTGSFDLTAY